MPIYTYIGNRDPNDGTASLKVASGRIPLGGYGVFTISEINSLFARYDLRPGIIIPDESDFPWVQSKDLAEQVQLALGMINRELIPYTWKSFVSTALALPSKADIYDVYLALDTRALYVWNGSAFEILTTFGQSSGTSGGITGGTTGGGGGTTPAGPVDTTVHASVPAAQFTHTGTDANGIQSWLVSASNNVGDHVQRVLVPDSPVAGMTHNFLLILPVEADWGATFGDAINYMRIHNIHNQYNLTLVELSFGPPTWYANNPNDSQHQYESFAVMDLAPWIRSQFAISSQEEIWVIGFSRSGLGCMDLLFKHPDVFARGAAWDFPGPDMTSYTEFGADNFGTQANFDSNYKLSSVFIDALKGPFLGRNRIWIGGYHAFFQDVSDFDALLTSKVVTHTLGTMQDITHAWDSGWVPAAVADLSQYSQIPSDDFNRANAASLGPNWTAHSEGSMAISGNAAIGTAASFRGDIRTSESFTSDQWAEISTTADSVGPGGTAGSWIGVTARSQGGGQNAYLAIYFYNSGAPVIQLYKRSGGAFAQLGSSYNSGSLPAGSKLRISAVGSTISVFLNGSLLFSANDSSFTNGNPGVMSFDVGKADDWIGGSGPGISTGGGSGASGPITFSPNYTDDFNRADAANLGSNWTAGADAGLHIVSQIAAGDQGIVRESFYSRVIFISDQYSQITLAGSANSGEWVGPSVRMSGDGQSAYLGIYYNNAGNPQLDIYKRVGGLYTLLGSPYALSGPLPIGTVLTLAVKGSTITLYQDGISRIVVTDTDIPSGGAPGIYAWGTTAIDNWGGDNNNPITVPPSNTSAPTISGSPITGHILTCNPGTWTQQPSFAFHWQTDASGSFANITGATSNTYVPVADDVGHHLRCQVTGINSIGASQPVSSAAVGPITAPSGASITDNFNRADGALANGWTNISDGGLVIATQQVIGVGSSITGDYRTGEAYTDDQNSQIDVETSPSNGDWIGPAVRVQNNGQNCYLGIYLNSAGTYLMRLYKRVSGSFIQIGNDYTFSNALAAGTQLSVSAVASTITFSQNGVARITITDTAIPVGGTPGIYAGGSSATADNWQGSNS